MDPASPPPSSPLIPPSSPATDPRRVPPVTASAAQPIIIQQPRGFLQRFVSWLGWAGFGFCLLLLIGQLAAFSDYFDTTGGISEKFHSGAKFAQDKVAIISISGVMLEGEGFVKKQIDRIRDDNKIKALVVRVDSPGGTVTAADYMYHHLKKLREEKNLPIVVSMGSIAASGGYYVSMAVGDQEKAIFAEPTTTTGSIGVIIPHYDLSGLLERFDVKDDSIASHPRKQMLSMTRPIPEDHREILKGYINESFERFKEIIRTGRPAFREHPENLDQLATGEIFTARQAQEKGLVDSIGFIEDAIDRACEIANVKKDSVRVVEYKRPLSLFDLSGMATARQQINFQQLLEMSTPRAFYLASSFPPLISSWGAGPVRD